MNPIWWRMYTFNNHPLVPVICYLWILRWPGIKGKYLCWWLIGYWMLSTQFYNSMFIIVENHGAQMQSNNQRLQICKCYSCFWVQSHSKSLEHYKHWFCFDDLSHCVCRTWKIVVVKLVVPIVWPIQEGINLVQKEVTTLEDVRFFFWLLHRNNIQSLFHFQSFRSSNSHVHVVSCHSLARPFDASCWPTTQDGKKVKWPFVFKIT